MKMLIFGAAGPLMHRRRAYVACLVAVILYLPMHSAIAERDPCSGPKHERPPECDDSGSGGGEESSTRVFWGVDGAFQEVPVDPEGEGRLCNRESASPGGDHGVYTCLMPSIPVYYDLSGTARQVTRKGNFALCNLFDGITLIPDAKYNYAWIDNCQDDGKCTARILNWFSEAEMTFRLPNYGVGVTALEALADIESPGTDLDPFKVEQSLSINSIKIVFTGVGTNKKLATCEYALTGSAIMVKFQSSPQ